MAFFNHVCSRAQNIDVQNVPILLFNSLEDK